MRLSTTCTVPSARPPSATRRSATYPRLVGGIGHLVEQFVQGDEVRALHVPVRLLGLQLEIDRIRKPPVQQHTEAARVTRARVGVLLNARLADTIDLQLQAKQAHWNVKGPNFIALHELFDKVAEAAEEATTCGRAAGGLGAGRGNRAGREAVLATPET